MVCVVADKAVWTVLPDVRGDVRAGHGNHDSGAHEQTAELAWVRVHAQDSDLHLLLGPARVSIGENWRKYEPDVPSPILHPLKQVSPNSFQKFTLITF